MSSLLEKLGRRSPRLGIRWKLIIPFLIITLLVIAVLLPITTLLIERRIEAEADRRLSQSAESVAALIERSAEDALLSANFVANLPEVEAAGDDKTLLGQALTARREELDLQELSFYAPTFAAGDPAYFYGGPIIGRRLQVSQSTQTIRDNLILQAIQAGRPISGIAIAPQSSQVIGVAPVVHMSDGELHGIVMAVFYLDEDFITEISQILGVKVGIVKDNAVIASTIDPASGYELLLQQSFIDPNGRTTARNLNYGENIQERLLAHPLILNGEPQGSVLVAQSIKDLTVVRREIQWLLFGFAAVVAAVSLVFAVLTFVGFARPIARLAHATNQVSRGNLDQRVHMPIVLLRDEITDLSENFNAMTARLQDLYTRLEQRVQERTRELVEERNKLNIALQELEIARDQALASNRAKSVFLANMSHELRTPLNAIIGYTNLVLAGTYGPLVETQSDRLQRVVDNGYHLLNLINDVLDLSKIEAGKMELYLEDFELMPMLDNVVSTVRPLIAKNNNTLVADFAPNLGLVYADLTKVRQVLFNLLSNAAKFTDKGTITFSAHPDYYDGAEAIRFTVSDSGIGMTPEQVEKIFREFEQADTSTTRKYGGTGLGLTITRHFCLMMGGEISVTSKAGQGSTFTVFIPKEVVVAETKPSSGVLVAKAPPSSERNRVLVIDDDAVVRELIEHYLTEEGFEVVTAANGEEGLRLAQEAQPSVITLDVMMSNMDGWTVLTKLKGDPELCKIPVVMLTIVDDKNMGYALGASDYITKPVDRARLVALLNKYRCGEETCPILVVEDDDATRKMMFEMLHGQGWEVIEAANGRIALERLAQKRPTVILLDLMMPELDGFEFVEAVRKNEEYRDIPIIVVTAMTLSQDDHLRLDGYVRKIVQKGNYTKEELLQEVRHLVNVQIQQQV